MISVSFKNQQLLGRLAASVGRACDFRSWGCEAEPHIGWRDYLNKLKKKINPSLLATINAKWKKEHIKREESMFKLYQMEKTTNQGKKP